MNKFVWDASAIINIKEPDTQGYSPGHSLFKDLADGWIEGPYLNIFPSILPFEINATVSRKHREGKKILREFYIVNSHTQIYPIDLALIQKTASLVEVAGFNQLHGADLIYACIAKIENAYLVTMDNHFEHIADQVRLINLNASKDSPNYRRIFGI